MAKALKSQGSVTYTISLSAWLRRDGRQWIACCPAVDVLTQATTKVAAKKALKEAVSLWFESCIDRDVLEEALFEAGFKKAKDGVKPPAGVGRVTVQRNQAKREEMSNIEVSIPAFIAARMSNNDGHATC
jgi:predicted RNase H-like HicB family nuclease